MIPGSDTVQLITALTAKSQDTLRSRVMARLLAARAARSGSRRGRPRTHDRTREAARPGRPCSPPHGSARAGLADPRTAARDGPFARVENRPPHPDATEPHPPRTTRRPG